MPINCIKQGDCLELMKDLADGSVDMILTDLPYGVLNKSNAAAKWDCQIPFEPLWAQYKRLIRDDGAIVLFAQGMFTAKLMLSNPKMWRYNLIWKKGGRCSGFLNANRQPLRNHEDIVVFSKKQTIYNPQMRPCLPSDRTHSRGRLQNDQKNSCYGDYKQVQTSFRDEKFPTSVLDFQPEHKNFNHPTEKPVPLLEHLIKTYTNEGMTVLDSCMGSGSTCVAAINAGRNYIGFELDEKYFDIAKRRIDEATNELSKRNCC